MDRSVAEGVVRLRVPPTYVLPDLDSLPGVAAAVPGAPTSGTTIVADTGDLALARWGVGLVHDDDAWRLTLPPHPAGEVSPVHHRVVTRPATIPAVLRHALGRLAREEGLARVVRFVVRRAPVALLGDADEPLVQVTDEEVSVHTGRRLTGRFREVVVHPGPAAPRRLRREVERLLAEAGALGREDLPRAVRVLGPAARGTPDLPLAAPGDAAATAWSQALIRAVHDLLLVDVHLRLDTVGDVAGPSLDVVDRVAGLVGLLDAPPGVRVPLATLRDRVVEVAALRARLEAVSAPAEVPGDHAAPALRRAAADDLAGAVGALHAHLDGDDHAAAVAGLRRLATDPGLDDDEAGLAPRASVARRVGKRWTPLVGGLADDAPGEPAELAALAAAAAVAPGKAPARFARAATDAACAARGHERATAVQRWLAEVATTLPPADAFVAGHLAGRRHDAAAEELELWAEALGRLDREKATRWLEQDADA